MRPFVKWAGGKKQIIDLVLEKIKYFVTSDNKDSFTFIEPFVGGGIVFITLKHQNTIINDLNKELMTAYRVIRNYPNELMAKLDDMRIKFDNDNEGYYLDVRGMDRKENYKDLDEITIAARMIFLNKTCFNGLYRVNSEGYFNTPRGRNKVINFYEKQNILSLSKFLNIIPEENIMNGSYKEAMRIAHIGDIVYLDPPYDYTANDGFTKYQKEGFSLEDLKEMKEECDNCLDEEAAVIISNNDTKEVRAAFKNDKTHNYSFYVIDPINTKRLINCKGDLRNTGKEIIIVGVPNGFPTYSDVDKYLSFARLKNPSDLSNENYLKHRFKLSKRSVDQVVQSMLYFGIINSAKELTPKGKELRKQKRKDANKVLKNLILKNDIFKDIFDHDKKDTSEKMDIDVIKNVVVANKPHIKDKMATKRAKIARQIVDWCLIH